MQGIAARTATVLVVLAFASPALASTLGLVRHASAVVVATVQETALAKQPELEPTTPAPTGSVGPMLNSRLFVGELVRIRIDEVLKTDGILVVGSVVDVYLPSFASSAAGWFAEAGRQYVLFLRLPVYGTVKEKVGGSGVRRVSLLPGSTGDEATDLDGAYRVVDAQSGGARAADRQTLTDLRVSVLAATRPAISIVSPSANAAVAGMVLLKADAHDDGGIAGVQFRVDGINAGPEDVERPFEYLWFSKSVFNGVHTIVAVARDGPGYSTTSIPVSFSTVNTNVGPTVTGGKTWDGAGWACRTAHAVKTDPDGDPLVCQWFIGDGGAGQCRPNCGGCGPTDDYCAGSNHTAFQQETCEISITCTDPWGFSDSETWTINRF